MVLSSSGAVAMATGRILAVVTLTLLFLIAFTSFIAPPNVSNVVLTNNDGTLAYKYVQTRGGLEHPVNVTKVKESLIEQAVNLYQYEDDYDNVGNESEIQHGSVASSLPPAQVQADGRMKRLPDCILVGERKTGTTAMMHFLATHPQIKASKREIHFFDMFRNYRKGLQWYRDKMEPTFEDEIAFEKSPRYFRTPYTPLRVYHMNPNIKLLLQVNNPIKRAISDFHFSMHSDWYAGFEKVRNKSFEEYAIKPDTGEVDGDFAPLQRSFYDVNMENWLRHFSIEKNFHIIDGGRFVTNPVEELQKIEKFLGIKPYFKKSMFFFSKAKGFYCLRDPGCISFGGLKHPPVDEKVLQKLHAFFEPHNQRFYQLVGKNFGW